MEIEEIENEANERFIGWAKFGIHFDKASFIEGARWCNEKIKLNLPAKESKENYCEIDFIKLTNN